MRTRTKLWLIMLISAFSSFVLFILLSAILGSNLGYDLNSLNAISQQTLGVIERQSTLDKAEIQPILEQAHNENPVLRLEWVSSDGSVLYDTSGHAQHYDFKQLADRFLNSPNNLWGGNETITLANSVIRDGQTHYLLMSLPSEAMKARQFYIFVRHYKALFTFSLPLLISALVPYFLSLWFFSYMNRRIGKLNHALNQINLRSDIPLLDDKAKDEIGQLTRHYNSMAQRIRNQSDQIEQFENRRKQLLSNLSHDLRTPLTMILGHAETIRTGAYNDENELQTSVKIILQRSRYMDFLLTQLLNITRQDGGLVEIHFASNNLSELLRKIVSDYLLFLDGQNFTVEIDIPENDIITIIDASLIERAIRNLLDNAIRYGWEGYFLGVTLVESDNEVRMIVKDRGKGIALENRERIFERFYREDKGRHGDGLGIGLSIVKEIAENHQGKVQLTSIPYVETTFQLILPKPSN